MAIKSENLLLPVEVAAVVVEGVEGVVAGVEIVAAMPLVVHYQQS
jgi:hypothetical protein